MLSCLTCGVVRALCLDKIVMVMARAFAMKLEKLGVNAAPLFLAPGELCLALPLPAEADPKDATRLYLAIYIDASHVTFLDDGTEKVYEVAKVTDVRVKSECERRSTKWPR